jgi:hypothetical protein
MRDLDRHLDPEDLERYSMGTGSLRITPLIEEHLLTCAGCQDRLRETDDYLLAVRTSAERLRQDDRTAIGREHRILTWFPALVAVACGLLLLVAGPRFFRQPGPVVAVSLTAMRGDGAGSTAPSGHELILRPNLTGLAEARSYRLEIVDGTGHTVRRGILSRARNEVQVPGLGSGLYFVRVYTPAGELLREYGLRIQ